MSELIIGVDVGFGNTKTAHKVFSSGVIKHSTKPPISSMVVETNGGFYSVGNPKITIQESKMNNEDMLVLTEAAIAEELRELQRRFLLLVFPPAPKHGILLSLLLTTISAM